MYILGISAFYHDSAAALLKDGKIIAAAQEERFSRRKHDYRFPVNAIKYCLEYAGISGKELSYVAFYDKPFLKFERLLETYLMFAPAGINSFIKSIPVWIKDKLWMKEFIYKELDFSGKILFPEHHESHAASAFYPSPFEEAAFITMDGVGEWTTTSYGVGKGNNIEILSEIKFPHSLGLLYSAFTYYTGFKVNSGEYKVMGLAPYGEPKYVDLIYKHLIDVKPDGSFHMNMEYFNYCSGLTMTNDKFHALFGGPPRAQESKLTQKEMDLARSVQEVTEEVVMRMARHVHKETGMSACVLAGGVALNCVANGKLLKEGPFKDLWIQPAAGDAGGSLGAALVTWYQYLGNERKTSPGKDTQSGSYLGPDYSEEYIESFLKEKEASYEKLSYSEIPSRIADIIANENVVGWFQGRMEFGPRALGARSIIGDARSPKMQSLMNLKIKFRESFRPFAPSVTRERMKDYFDLDYDSPYMLLVANIVDGRRRKMTAEEEKLFGIDKVNVVRSDVPAITHIDYSARIQTVHKDTNALYYDMIDSFDKKYGCPVIINTSFNVRGEPIVNSPGEAFTCFMRTDIDYLLLGPYLLDKKKQKLLQDDIDWRKEFELD
ncbi:MAG: carbamoyltransferase [Ignavibacteriaceae bacterium]|nr:carbamoyltransferase [Ignavibacteriaceae bacterium]